ncbi:hypothetical protein EU245_10750 [Lentibacillus lipolyticus]|nr:hypothetical protein EU245_10750 [Lentibacillus lipolyticus]
MKNLSLFGKITFGVGVIFFIMGIYLFIQKFDGSFVFKEHYQDLGFISLGIALFFAAFLYKQDEHSGSDNH